MPKPLFVVLIVIGFLAGMGLYFVLRGGDTPAATSAEKAVDSSPQAASPARSPEALPKRAFCPVSKPKTVPDAVGLAFSSVGSASPRAPLKAQLAELQALAKKPVDGASAASLRWLMHQPKSPEVVRNEVLKTLGAWNPTWLVGDLARMMQDSAQSDIWRAYCVQHLGHHYGKYQDQESLGALKRAIQADDWAIREQAIFTLAAIAKDFNWRERKREQFEEFADRVESALVASNSKLVVSGLRSAAVAGLKELAPRVEKLAADTKQELKLRVAAVQALGKIGRPESIPILEACAKSRKETLARFAKISLRNLKENAP